MPKIITAMTQRDLEEAFANALSAYGDWSPGQPEPEISIRQTKFSMTAVCGLFDQFGNCPMVLCGPNVELRRRPWRSERFLSRLQSGPLVVRAQILNCSIMAAFLHRRPNTGMNVQGWVADDPTEGEGETYQPITCTIRTRLHLVDPKTEWS